MIDLTEYQALIDNAIQNAKNSGVKGATVFVGLGLLDNSVYINWNTCPNPKIGVWREPEPFGWGYHDFSWFIHVWEARND